jgi:hypothetical protein
VHFKKWVELHWVEIRNFKWYAINTLIDVVMNIIFVEFSCLYIVIVYVLTKYKNILNILDHFLNELKWVISMNPIHVY